MARAAQSLFDPRGAWQRLAFSALAAGIAWLVLPSRLPIEVRVLGTWTIGSFALLVIVGFVMVQSDSAETGRRAAAHDPGRTFVWLLTLGASSFSLFGATVVARYVTKLSHRGNTLLLLLCVASVAVSWAITHAGFTLRYAHLYYRQCDADDTEGGIELPGGQKPDDLDFAYFAFTIGMCFQVSDATISDRTIRRTVLAHAMLSFAYNTVIIALALNLVAGHLG